MYYSKLFVFSLVCSAVVFSSCSKHSTLPQSPESSIELTDAELVALDNYANGSVISENEVLEHAGSIMEQLDSYSLTKGSSPRYVSSITPIRKDGGVGTKADGEEDIAYIVNFGDSLGYSVLSADRRTDDVFMISPSGNLNLETMEQDYSDGKIPEGALFLMANIGSVMEAQIESYEQTADELEASALEKIGAEDGNTKAMAARAVEVTTDYSLIGWNEGDYYTASRTETTDWTKVASGSVRPMIRTQWGQNGPFNNQIPLIGGRRPKTGCVPTAMAQLMTYWEYPKTYNWNSLKPYTYMTGSDYTTPKSVKDEVARLMYDIGRDTGVEYGINQSGATIDNAIGYFSKVRYKNPGVVGDYDENRILTSLYNGRPVLMSGFAYLYDVYLKIWFISIHLRTDLESGHCWVIDGALRQKKTTTVYRYGRAMLVLDDFRTLFHCNFGNYGLTDGYYVSNCFDTKNAEIHDVIYAGGPKSGTKGIVVEGQGEEGYYQFDLKGVYDIQAY